MNLEDRVALAAKDEKLKNELIGEYQNFILSSASKALKRSVTVSDDEFITAMMAFNEAIDSYDSSKGRFVSFASVVIRNRIIDDLRRSSKHAAVPFSSLSSENDEGEIKEFDAAAADSGDLKWEIEALTAELDKFGISFFELAQVSPKSRKTKRLCFDAVRYISENPDLTDTVIRKHILPINEITAGLNTNRKTLERHRKYIITAVIAVTQDYPAIAEYFNIKEV
ncbi:MAG: sigma-70 family RNA polymerase sigma factor [Firmicutes bacterium]|nr:sigma-70 family RNA polymerase sigma factor [Bacillota bacterium]